MMHHSLIKPKLEGKKIRAEINEMETKATIKRANKNKRLPLKNKQN